MGKPSASKPLPASAGFTPAQVRAANEARARAESATPAVVREALLGAEIKVGDVTLPVIMIGHVLLLQQLESPLATSGGGPVTNAQVCEALFVLNRPAREVRALLRESRAAFEDAVLEFAAGIPLRDLPAIGAALAAQLRAAESTIVGSTDSPASSGEGTVAAPGAKKNAGPAATVTSPATAAGSPARPTG